MVIPTTLIAVFALTRVYRHPVRYFSSTDAYRLLAMCCLVWMLSAIIIRVAISTSSLILSVSCLASLALMFLPRVIYQQGFSRYDQRKRAKKAGVRTRIAVCGDDTPSVSLCNFLEDGFKRAEVVGIIADDKDLSLIHI